MKRAAVLTPPGKRGRGRLDPSYLALIRRFPLRPLRSDRAYDAALVVLDALAVRPEGSLGKGEQDYFETLTLLVDSFDSKCDHEQHRAPAGHSAPLANLKYVMEQSGTTQADLGRLLGSRTLASLILNGRRQLSKAHVRKLATHFQVCPALFLAGE